MDNKQLLERAAKAAGLNIDKSEYNGGGIGNTGFDSAGNAVLDWHNGRIWNPIKNDADAFRLMVDCTLVVDCAAGILITPGGGCHETFEQLDTESLRLAITRAAAQSQGNHHE